MRATQKEIARQVGLDVSSVNKILSNRAGAVFRDKTKALVFKTAKKLGYDFGKASKGNLVKTLLDLFPPGVSDQTLAITRGIPIDRVAQIRDLIKRAGGAAIVLLVLRSIFILM